MSNPHLMPLPAPTVKVKFLSPDGRMPVQATPGSAGFDLCSAESKYIVPGQIAVIECGIAVEIPEGFEGQVRPRSGLALKHGLTVLNSPGTIDSDYRGPVKVILVNHGPDIFYCEIGMRIAQLVVTRVEKIQMQAVEVLSDGGQRGVGGFGSTGK